MSSLILYNANIITIDKTKPDAEALVIENDRIIYVGRNKDALSYNEMLSDASVINLKGLTVIPGFNDNHVHALSMGVYYNTPDLYGKNSSQIIRILKENYKNSKKGEILTGVAWDYPFCPYPNKNVLDKAFPDNPVYLRQYSGHAVWVNSLMLKKLGISKNTKNTPGGRVEKDKSGELTGIIRGSFIFNKQKKDLLDRVKNHELHKSLLEFSLKKFKEAGITSVQDNTWNPYTVSLLNDFLKNGKLTCRFSCWANGRYKLLKLLMDFSKYDDLWIRKGPVKYITDGAFSPKSALMSEPYMDENDNFGKQVLSEKEIIKIVENGARSKRQLAFHAIGDKAINNIVNTMENVSKKYPEITGLRFRLEHAQIILPGDFSRIKNLGILIAGQPTACSTPEKDFNILGQKRFKLIYPFKSILNNGINLSFGSDIPGENEYNPFVAIQNSVTRAGVAKSKFKFEQKEKLSVYEALYCYTMGSAYAEFMENEKGSITAGKLADLVVISENILKVKPEKIKDIKVVMTIVGGNIVYSANIQ